MQFAASTALLAFLSGCEEKQTAAPAGPPEVLVTAVAQQDVPIYREWLGTLDGSSNADIRARVQGYLMKQNYQEGALVKTGDLLFEIDARPFEASLAQAKADLATSEARQGKTENDEKRQAQLFAQKASSEQDRDNAVQSNAAAKASVEAAKAAVQQAEINLAFTRVTAPIDGIAGIAIPGIGDLVGPSSGVLTTISTVDPIKARFPISEQEYLGGAKALTAVMEKPFAERRANGELILADGSVFPEKGKFLSVDRQVQVQTGTILIEILFPNPGNVLRPGQYARVRTIIETQTGALVVPQRAVNELQGSYSVGVVGTDGKVEIRPVKVGPRIASSWVISSGLNPGEKVIVEGIQKVKGGSPVNAKPWTPPSEKAAAPAAEAKPEAKH